MKPELKAIQYQNSYLFVGGTPSKNYDGYYFIDGKIFHTSKTMLQSGCNVLVAQSPELSIPDIPYVELEEEVANNLAKDYSVETYKHSPFRSMAERAYMEGYKTALQRKAQAKKYTEEEALRLAIHCWSIASRPEYGKQYNINEIVRDYLQSLQPKIESIELEMPSCGCKDFGLYRHNTPCINKGVCDIPVTYQKDGKTFLKVKSITHAK